MTGRWGAVGSRLFPGIGLPDAGIALALPFPGHTPYTVDRGGYHPWGRGQVSAMFQ